MKNVSKLIIPKVAALCRSLSHSAAVQRFLFNAVRLNRQEMRPFILDDSIRFMSYCLARRDKSRSQILQDLWVCFELGEKKSGFFVEFGATDGIKNSNTFYLEKSLGWTGILAEPNPMWHAELTRNREASIEIKCVSSRSGDKVSFITTNDTDPELSGIDTFSNANHVADMRRSGQRIDLETISLDDLLDKYQAPATIDYLSIDTEGSELDIISSYSFGRRFRTISIENNPQNEKEIDRLLAAQGYVRVFSQFSQWDSWYVAAELRQGKTLNVVAPEG